MAWLRRAGTVMVAAALAAAALTVLNPDPPKAQANVACDVGIAPGAVVTDVIGIGNPVGDACEAITDPVLGALPDPLDPIKDAASSIGQGVFDQITAWATDGAVWLLGEVVTLTDKTTSPNLLSKGFVRQYRAMASIATVLALLMLLFAVLESLGRGDGGMLVRVFLVNVPLAAIATSAAYVVVQLLIATTDGFCEAIAHSTAADTRAFFKSAIEGLSSAGGDAGTVTGTAVGGPAQGTATGAAASVEVPMFVGFIAAIVAAFAAFLVWIELLMRDAAIYAVALFMPLAIAASIWPRWMSALRKTAELVIVVVFSKFVIVAVIALAASLMAHGDGGVEQVLAAGALLLLACFSPFVLFKLVPFAEGAVGAAFNRQSAAGAGSHAIQTASSLQMMRASAHANWGGGNGSPAGGKSGGAEKGSNGRVGGGWGDSAGEAAEAGGGAGGVAALPVAAAGAAVKGTKAAAGELSSSGTAQAAGDAGGEPGASSPTAAGGGDAAPRPAAESSPASSGRSASPASAGQPSGEGDEAGRPSPSPPTTTPSPADAAGGAAPGEGGKPARPGGDVSPASKPGSGAKAQP